MPVEVTLNKDGTRWAAELRGQPDTRSYGRTLGEASERARRKAALAQATGRLSSSSSTDVA